MADHARDPSITFQAVDCLLYNRRGWRAAIAAMAPRTSTSMVVLPVSKSPGDPVGSVAISRATISLVLDTVDRAVRHLPREYRRIARHKYDDLYTHKAIADVVGYSEKTIERRVDVIRNSVRHSLDALGASNVRACWAEIGKLVSESCRENV